MTNPKLPSDETINKIKQALDEICRVLEQPLLPPDHPQAADQRRAKRIANDALARMSGMGRKMMRQILDMPPLPPDHPNAAVLREAKESVRVALLWWNAHYGPGGRLAGMQEPIEDD